MSGEKKLGAILQDGRCLFRVWAPHVEKVDLHICSPEEHWVRLKASEHGYHEALLDGVAPGALYFYRLNEQQERPDPASRLQPQGVHGPSQVVDPSFRWHDAGWKGLPLQDYVVYELHVGTYTQEGTFDAILPHLPRLRSLGITAIEIMPVAQFPGKRNWGYDGVDLFAVQDSYGGPEGLKRLVDACHQQGMAMVLDVVYNHLGPEGNYLREFGPYFTTRYHTPWGSALNFGGAHSDEVRHFFIENALQWTVEFHVDALRLDALHAIADVSAHPFLEELTATLHETAKRYDRKIHVIAETDLNDPRFIRPRESGGFGMDAQWNDDFHHSLHALLVNERSGYYQDFGSVAHLAKAFEEGYVYCGQHSPFRKRRHGRMAGSLSPSKFVVFTQNHDQVGNRMRGERLCHLVSFEAQKLAAAAALLSPFVPMLFMGEEYAETAPFQYFVSHSDAQLIEAVRKGRSEEFTSFAWQGELPDPQAEGTFARCRLNHHLREEGPHRLMWQFYTELLKQRRDLLMGRASLEGASVATQSEQPPILIIRHAQQAADAHVIFHFGEQPAQVSFPLPAGKWRKSLDTSNETWGGKGSEIPDSIDSAGEVNLALAPYSCLLLRKAGVMTAC